MLQTISMPPFSPLALYVAYFLQIGLVGLAVAAGLAFLAGSCAGSFANACAMRLVRNEDFIYSRSRCRGCDRQLRWHENLPLLGYALQRGKCRSCGSPISIRYPAVEFAAGLLVTGYCLTLPPAMAVGFSLALIFVGVACLTDMEALTLHPMLLSLLGLFGLLFALAGEFGLLSWHIGSAQSLSGILFAGLLPVLINTIYRAIRGHNGFGEGDFWMMAALGAWLGPIAGMGLFLLASWLGAMVGIGMMIAGRASSMTRLPFGLFAGIVFILWPNLFTRVF